MTLYKTLLVGVLKELGWSDRDIKMAIARVRKKSPDAVDEVHNREIPDKYLEATKNRIRMFMIEERCRRFSEN